MKQILDAILAGDSAAVGELDVPEHYRGITVHADEAAMFDGLDSKEKDPRKSLHLDDVPTPELGPGEALVAVMEHIEDGRWLEQTLTALGQKHVDYGVTEEMYDWVGASLLAALAEAAGEDWTPELEAAWRAAYGAIAGLMQQGAAAS